MRVVRTRMKLLSPIQFLPDWKYVTSMSSDRRVRATRAIVPIFFGFPATGIVWHRLSCLALSSHALSSRIQAGLDAIDCPPIRHTDWLDVK